MKKLTLFFALLLVNHAATAQSPTSQEVERSNIKVYNADQSDKDQSDNSYRWAIKTDLTSLISQEFPIIAEYRITKKISIEASAAITYAYFSNDDYFDQLKNEDLDKKPETDNAFRIGVKYYPSRRTNALDGWFVGLQAFTKNTKRSYDELPGLNGREVFDTKNKEGIAIQLGKQIFTSNNFLYEALFGIGLANVTRDYYVRNEKSIFTFDQINDKKTSVYFQLGLRVGLGN
ncbi:DUF3575 domain-containing protein [Flavobacterium hercynium]|uniref:DUF3575 domain-containing protein n=1 Tax=Flavobacterium hercynium TaxID=387094 RepID=A0A226GUF2_9FLAO|nr:DUF3575 domain-containing protein [Flavobacterium hercynium]OXA84950.1 hypothetical protein B0A66_20020 [Flavobacterium hercynium]SMP35009.1 Protein of unknown function [Flavobacterium hercynium]